MRDTAGLQDQRKLCNPPLGALIALDQVARVTPNEFFQGMGHTAPGALRWPVQMLTGRRNGRDDFLHCGQNLPGNSIAQFLRIGRGAGARRV